MPPERPPSLRRPPKGQGQHAMTRSYSLLLACLALSVACASSSKGSNDPDAGQYDEYYGENGSNAGGGGAASPSGSRPKARVSTSTRSGAKKTGKSTALAPTKPPVTGGDKPRPTRPPRSDFAIDGVFPTTAAVGSLIEVYGSSFPEDPKAAKVFMGGKALKVVEATADRIVAEVGATGSGVIEVGRGTGRVGR